MNALQLSKQFRFLLRARTWPDAGGETIFGSVHVSDMPSEEAYPLIRMPACFIHVGGDEPHPQTPGKVSQDFTFTVMADGKGDRWNENGIIGGPRVNGNLSSKGRGVLELDEEIRRTFVQVQETLGVKIIARPSSSVGTATIEGLGAVSARDISIKAECTSLRYYHPPIRLVGPLDVDNHVQLSWVDPPNRFDRRSVIRIRRSAGSTPPASVTAGTQIADLAIGVQSYLDTPASGTWSYSVFAAYTDSGVAQNERFSDLEDGAYITVVVP